MYIFTLWVKDAYVDSESVMSMFVPQQAASSLQPRAIWEQFLGWGLPFSSVGLAGQAGQLLHPARGI